MEKPPNLVEFARVEFWADTKWEPYKEGVQQEIRRLLTTDGKDLADLIETTIGLDYGDEAWIYTAHFFPKELVPASVVGPCKKKMMDKANNPKLFTNWSHAWVCVYQSHKTQTTIPIDPLPVEHGPHGERGAPRQKKTDLPRSKEGKYSERASAEVYTRA